MCKDPDSAQPAKYLKSFFPNYGSQRIEKYCTFKLTKKLKIITLMSLRKKRILVKLIGHLENYKVTPIITYYVIAVHSM